MPSVFPATSSTRRWPARMPPSCRSRCCGSSTPRARGSLTWLEPEAMRIRQHVNPLKSDLLDIADVPRIVAEPGRPIEVELGAAEAYFLIDRARRDSATSFVGVEIRRELVEAVNAACAAGGPANVRSVFANMSVDMERLFADASVRRFYLNFPDPWFKSRQHKRRVIGPGLMA